MNEDLSSVIEHALLYASPLPVTSAAENTDTSGEGYTANVAVLSQNEPISSFDSTVESFTQLKSVQLPKTVPVHIEELGVVKARNSKRSFNNDTVTESVIKRFIDDTLHVQSAVFDAQVFDNVTDNNDSLNLANSGKTNNTRSEATVSRFHLLPIEKNGETADLSHPSVPSPSTRDLEPCEVNKSQLEKSSSTSIEGSLNSDQPKPKKKRNREKNPDPRPEPILPPCTICNEKSSGFHYGANTCEACKAFFRRSQKTKKIGFKCKCKPDERQEWKVGPIKNGCAACRYERCLMVGMSKTAIKIGRYTLNHKTKNIKEIKLVEGADNLQQNTMSPLFESSPSSSSGLDIGMSSPENILSPASTERSEISEASSTASRDMNLGACASPWTQTLPSTRNTFLSLKEIDFIVKTLSEAQTRVPFDDSFCIPVEVIKRKQTEYLEKYKLKAELFGDMGLSKEEFNEFYNITGIDLDGRIQHIDGAFQFFEQKISLVVAFAKSIPEFKTLKLDDQANLIKASRVENIIFGGFKGIVRNFDMERRVVSSPWGKEIHMDELARLIPIDFLLKKYSFAKQILELNLTEQEEGVIRAIVTMFSDRCILQEPQKVDRIQEKLVACLQHLFSIRPGGPGTLLYKIFTLITNLRDFTENETAITRKMLVDYPMLSSNKYQLLKEFLT